MKKVILSLIFVGFSINVIAQKHDHKHEAAPLDWFHRSIDEEVFGVNTHKAYAFLEKTGRIPQTVIVGILDSGVDADHEDLKDVMWVNKKEIANNGLDDDKNGYIDDIHGWNFLGNADGTNIKGDNLEIIRLYAKYRSKFQDLSDQKLKKNIQKYPKEYEIYLEGIKLINTNTIQNKIELSELKAQKEQFIVYESQFTTVFEKIKKLIPTKKISANELKPLIKKHKKDKQAYAVLGMLYEAAVQDPNQTINIDQIQKEFNELLNIDTKNLDEYISFLESKINYHYNPDLDTRKIIGDDYDNKKDSNYGNNDVKGPYAMHGTHVAGLVAAVRNNGIGMDGVANNVQIMGVRIVPDGDERDKDVANGIIYAVDNGAKIINMSFGKKYSPDKPIVDDAIRYAEKKGALLIHAAGNDGEDLDLQLHYPVNIIKNDTIATNWITVGASTPHKEHLAATFSNYGSKTVDLFSPGTEIYSTTPNNQYQSLQGTSMATPIVSGVAALVWSYYPELTAHELRNVLLQSVNVYKATVPTPTEKKKKTALPFTSLSTTGGVIDAYNAVKIADNFIKNKNTTSIKMDKIKHNK
ncbi:MAG: S8 family peptidase [Flavobacteriales bacterium]